MIQPQVEVSAMQQPPIRQRVHINAAGHANGNTIRLPSSANRTALETFNPSQKRLWIRNCAVGTGTSISSALRRLSSLFKCQGKHFLNIQRRLAVFAADVFGENLSAAGIQQYEPSNLTSEKLCNLKTPLSQMDLYCI